MNDHTVPQLPPRSQCTGCAACAEGCPKNAIHMLPDREGFLYPTVTDACIQCGHCTHICPVLRQREAHPEPAVFAAWNPDNAVRQNSTCGGVFSLLADYVLEGGGVVYGAAHGRPSASAAHPLLPERGPVAAAGEPSTFRAIWTACSGRSGRC